MVEENNETVEQNNAVTQEPSEPVQEAENIQTEEKENAQELQDSANAQSGSGADEEHVKHVQNWRALREQREQERRERERIQRERDELLAQIQRQRQSQTQENEDDDDLIEKRELRKTENRVAQLEARLVDAEVRAKFPDFKNVVTEEAVEMLKDADPELVESIISNKNPFSQAAVTYRAIKRYGFAKPSYTKQKETVAKNSAKPRPVNSINPQQGDSPLSKANAFAQGLTEERKKEIWEECQAIVRNR